MLPSFLEQVQDKVQFERVVEHALLTTWTAMIQANKCLHPDFQAMIRSDGQIFHIDLDRCFLPAPRNRPNRWSFARHCCLESVSYTHLTLPTIYSV